MHLRLQHLDVMTTAKIVAIIYAVFGVIIGICYALFFLLFAGAMGLTGDADELAGLLGGGMVGSLCMVILIPLFYAFIGFVAGALGAWLYNFAAARIGGVTMRFDALEGMPRDESIG